MSTEGTENTAKVIGPFTIHLNGNAGATRLEVGGVEIHLRKSEQLILALLAPRADTFVAKTSLYRLMYEGKPDSPDPKILDVFVCGLRREMTAALVAPPPRDTHYLVGDGQGNFGLFSTPRPMAKVAGKRGKRTQVGRELVRLQLGGMA